jgi:UDP-N-acetylmuramyl pentapeptide phosphotransferase/UDP-N-acetylglucosamine-1-phosphate transferase
MPFVFIIVGIVLLTSGVRGQSSTLLTLVKGDLTGSNNFIYWIVSILVIGSIGYIDDLKSLSRAFLVLVIVVLVLNEDKNGTGGFFASFQSAISSITKGGS